MNVRYGRCRNRHHGPGARQELRRAQPAKAADDDHDTVRWPAGLNRHAIPMPVSYRQ